MYIANRTFIGFSAGKTFRYTQPGANILINRDDLLFFVDSFPHERDGYTVFRFVTNDGLLIDFPLNYRHRKIGRYISKLASS